MDPAGSGGFVTKTGLLALGQVMTSTLCESYSPSEGPVKAAGSGPAHQVSGAKFMMKRRVVSPAPPA